jgi:hypothetical protein
MRVIDFQSAPVSGRISHSVGNYKWVFEIPNVQGERGKGHVKSR